MRQNLFVQFCTPNTHAKKIYNRPNVTHVISRLLAKRAWILWQIECVFDVSKMCFFHSHTTSNLIYRLLPGNKICDIVLSPFGPKTGGFSLPCQWADVERTRKCQTIHLFSGIRQIWYIFDLSCKLITIHGAINKRLTPIWQRSMARSSSLSGRQSTVFRIRNTWKCCVYTHIHRKTNWRKIK